MLIVKKPEKDGGWYFTVKLTGEEFAGLDANAFNILFAPTKVGDKRYPTSSLLAVLTTAAHQAECRQEQEEEARRERSEGTV